MAVTRSSTGHSKPRIHLSVSTEPERRSNAAGAKKHSAGARAGTGVHKQKRAPPATHHKRKPRLGDKIEGAAQKAVGKVTRRPGKKAAGTRKMRGTDGKGSRAKRVY
ncbi:hypothetical protein GGS23DRAFT_112001 [Durotheca rogersii]|uniref:uncharacterized protein n=1 Tax=Durotheca rogersii TaxID=419775 RepID=UPI002220E10C|nr:uncharacterized protein GGS23DRAFT_112001 [Durotheca rogersii]KAI5862215.1 hypothetical protein GGS23DRAFT_112001 [Durotheca rogersii]